MENQNIFIKISDCSEDLVTLKEKTFNFLKGEIIHLIMSKIITFKQLKDISFIEKVTIAVIAMIGIKKDNIDIYQEFIIPIYNINELKDINIIFSDNIRKLYIEKEIILSKKYNFSIYRPDRIIVTKDNFLVVDFKSEYPSIDIRKKYYKQLNNYINICKQLFGINGAAYIIYIKNNIIEKFNIGSLKWEIL